MVLLSMTNPPETTMHFRSVPLEGVVGRTGKHHTIVAKVLEDVKTLSFGRALQVPLPKDEGIARLRTALHRRALQINITIRTRADKRTLYVYRIKT